MADFGMNNGEILAELVRWERFFASGGTASEDLLALDSPDARIGLSGSGVVSTRFICQFEVGRLAFDCTCVTGGWDAGGDESPRRSDALATVRLAILLVCAERERREWFANDPRATVRVESDETGASFSVRNADGEVCVSEVGWDGLLRLLDWPPENGETRIWV